MENILEVNNLSKQFSEFALRDVSFSIPRGYVMGFIGPNGAGKTVTIKLIMNLLKKGAGEIKVFGQDHLIYEKEIKERIGFVYDEGYFYEDVTIPEMKRIIAPFYKKWDDAKYKQYVKDFELPAKTKIKDLSKGMKMKFALALALSHDAELIIMDEPTSGLDPIFRSEFLDILRNIMQDENKGVLFSTHITTDLERIADYISFIHRGAIVFSGSKDEMLSRYVLVKGRRDLLTPETRQLLIGCRENEFGFEALSEQPVQLRQRLGEQVLIEKAALDAIMLYTVRGGKP